MNVVRAFAEYLQDSSVAALGTDLFVSRAPSSNQVGDRIFWLKASGGGQVGKSVGGRVTQTYVIEIYLRDASTQGVYDTLQALGDDLTTPGCIALPGYDVIELTTAGPWIDQDLDDEEREVGLLQVTLTIRKES